MLINSKNMKTLRIIMSDLFIKDFIKYMSIFDEEYTMQKYPYRQVRFDVKCDRTLYNMIYSWLNYNRIENYFIINDYLVDDVTMNDILTNEDLYYKYIVYDIYDWNN